MLYTDGKVLADEVVGDEKRADRYWWDRRLPGVGGRKQHIVTVIRFDPVAAMAAGFAKPRCMGPPRVIDPAHSNLKALIGSLPKVKGEQAGVSPHLATSSNPPVAD
eukprot:5539125-Alexandrium_andersonii.AAC.1